MTHDYGSARVNMVENQVRTNDVTDHAIQDAMGVAPRERLCPPGRDFLAYAETPVEYAPGRFLMAPRDIAKLLQAIKPQPGERALCICAPYAALLLAEIGLSVVALEPGDSLEIARKALAEAPVEVTSINVPSCAEGEPEELVEVPVGTGGDVLAESDCTSDLTDPADDVEGLNHGFPTLTVVPAEPATPPQPG